VDGKEKRALSLKKVIRQYEICLNNVIGFLKVPACLNTRLAAKTHHAVGEFLLEAKNKEWFLTLQEGTLIPVASRRDRQHFRPEKQKKRTMHQNNVFYGIKQET
jgi:hypothetical protein